MKRRLTIVTGGTLGDLWPVLALGRALRQRGHHVRVAAAPSMMRHVRAAGLIPRPYGCDLGPEYARAHAACWDHWMRVSVQRCSPSPDDLLTAIRGSDLVLTTTAQPLGVLAAAKARVPALTLALSPLTVAKMPGRVVAVQRSLPGVGWPEPVVAGISPAYCAVDPAWRTRATLTGFWWYTPPAWRHWRPDRAAARFIGKEPPLVLGFSSLPLCDRAHVACVHAEAAALLGRRLVILGGWAGITARDVPARLRAHVLVRAAMPHEWLFRRAAAVIHHGGIGTLARAARHGLPMLVEPFCHDQFFNAWRVLKLGIGAAARTARLTAVEAATLLEAKVMTTGNRRRVAALARIVERENGVAAAVALIEQRL